MEIVNCARILGCKSGALPFKYLGVPVGANMSMKKNWRPIIDRVQNRLSTWKAKALSFGGRLTLTIYVLGSLPLYFFSLFRAPPSVINEIEKIRRRFLWGGNEEKNKINWVSWKVVLGPKNKGGLGIGSMGSLNWALLLKWVWRFKVEKNALWRSVICGTHNLSRKPIYALRKKSIPGVWQNITKIVEALEKIGIKLPSIFSFKVGTGEDTLFWFDWWTNQGELASIFPRLLALEKRKYCYVDERLSTPIRDWKWKRKPSSVEEVDELNALTDIVNNRQLSTDSDLLHSCLHKDGIYFVSNARELFDTYVTTPMMNNVIWLHLVPIKINCFLWRVCIGRIPTADALSKRGINVRDSSCRACGAGMEDADHLFAGCPFAKDVLRRIWSWCSISPPNFESFNEIIVYAAKWGNCPKKRKILLAIIYGYVWCLWRTGNDSVQ